MKITETSPRSMYKRVNTRAYKITGTRSKIKTKQRRKAKRLHKTVKSKVQNTLGQIQAGEIKALQFKILNAVSALMNCYSLTMAFKRDRSLSVTNVTAYPSLPALAVRPTR